MVEKKRPSESRTQNVQILSQSTLNGYKRLFGGRLMEWIDVVAAVAARRHSNLNVTTAAVDSLVFKEAAYSNDTIVLDACVTYTGKSSMEVRVRTFVEELNGARKLINTAYVIMVALDENENPAQVPGLILETEEEIEEYKAGERRYIERKKRNN